MEKIHEHLAGLRLEVASHRYRLYDQVLTRAERKRMYEELDKVYKKLEEFEKYIRTKLVS